MIKRVTIATRLCGMRQYKYTYSGQIRLNMYDDDNPNKNYNAEL